MTWIRRVRLAFAGAVAVTAITVATAGAAGTTGRAGDAASHTPTPGFLLDRGRLTTFDVPGATVGTSPGGVDNRGRIAGKYNDGTTATGPGASEHGFLRDRRGRFTTIDVPGSMYAFASGINDRGQIAGAYRTPPTTMPLR